MNNKLGKRKQRLNTRKIQDWWRAKIQPELPAGWQLEVVNASEAVLFRYRPMPEQHVIRLPVHLTALERVRYIVVQMKFKNDHKAS